MLKIVAAMLYTYRCSKMPAGYEIGFSNLIGMKPNRFSSN